MSLLEMALGRFPFSDQSHTILLTEVIKRIVDFELPKSIEEINHLGADFKTLVSGW